MKLIPQGSWDSIMEYRSKGIFDTGQIELALGLPKQSIKKMLEKGRKAYDRDSSILEEDESQCLRFYELWCSRALNLEVFLLSTLTDAAMGGKYQAGIWLLQQLMPHKYGTKVENSSPDEYRLVLDRSSADRKAIAAKAHAAMDVEFEQDYGDSEE